MAAPTIVRVYPADGDSGIPVGETLKIWFDRGVDEKSIVDSVVLFGAENDVTSGPDSAMWIDRDTAANPWFLTSPGFNGIVPVKIELAYWDTTDTTNYAEVTPGSIGSEADELAGNYGHVAKITVDPEFAATLAADTEYKLYVNGDPDGLDTGVAARTLFDVVASTTGEGSLEIYGQYEDEGAGDDTLNIEITTGGDIGTAKYRWWWTSGGVGSATTGRVTSRRYRRLGNGLQVRFTGSGFVAADSWTANVESIERLATSSVVTFTTNDGSYTTAPDSPSTPAASEIPSTVASTTTTTTAFTVESVAPAVGSYNVNPNERTITIVFSDDLDASTVTDDAVTLTKYPVEGEYDCTEPPSELSKSLEVSGNTLVIRY